MKRAFLVLSLILLSECISPVTAQHYFARYMIVGTSLTYIRNTYEDPWGYDYPDDEFTWNINLGIPLNKRVFTGLQVLNIYASEVSEPKEYYTIYGLFTQYNFLNDTDHRFFAELSFSRGNYCTCAYLPSRKENLFYLGVGLGYDLPFKKIPNLYLDLSFLSYAILNRMEEKYFYTQYVLGLNYRFLER